MRHFNNTNRSQINNKINDFESNNNINDNTNCNYQSFSSNNSINEASQNIDDLQNIKSKQIDKSDISLNNNIYKKQKIKYPYSKKKIMKSPVYSKSSYQKNHINDSSQNREEFSDEDSYEFKRINDNNISNLNNFDDEDSKDGKNRIEINNNYLNRSRYLSLNKNNNNSKINNNSEKIFNSRKDLISSLNSGKISPNKRYSIFQNFSKLNKILSSRNTFPINKKPSYSYSYLVNFLSNKNGFNQNNNNIKKKIINNYNNYNNNDINHEEQARIIQKWWRNKKKDLDKIINKIIKIQSVWRGVYSRKYNDMIIVLCFSCQKFYNILSKIMNYLRRYAFDILFRERKEKILKARKLFNRLQYINPYFQRWKCITKLLLIRDSISDDDSNKLRTLQTIKNIIFRKIPIYIVNVKYVLRKFFLRWQKKFITKKLFEDVKNRNNNKIILKNNENNLLRNDNKYSYKNDDDDEDGINKLSINEIVRNSLGKIINRKKDNNYLKKYYLYKWHNQVKNIQINEIKKKLLTYIINNISRKFIRNKKYKYFARWKLLTDDYINDLKKSKMNKDRLNKIKNRKNKIKLLVQLTSEIFSGVNIIFLRELIRKWRFLIFAKKLARDKMLKMYEVMEKTYTKMTEDMYDFDQKKKEKYFMINNNDDEDQKNFVEHVQKIYNSKTNNKVQVNCMTKKMFKIK